MELRSYVYLNVVYKFYYNGSKIKRRLILDLTLIALSVLILAYAPVIGKLIGIAAVLFISYDVIKLFKLGLNQKPQLIFYEGILEFRLNMNRKFPAASISEFEVKSLGSGLSRLMFHNVELKLTRAEELNGKVFNKKETVDITFLAITSEELAAILSDREPSEDEKRTYAPLFKYEEGNLEYGNFFFASICLFFAYRSAFDYKSFLGIENDFDRANPFIAILRAIDMVGGQALVVDLFLTMGIYFLYEVFRQIMAKRNR